MKPIPLADSADEATWLEARRTGLTATDMTKLQSGSILAKQAMYKAKTEGEKFHGNQHTERGKMLEPLVAEWVEAHYGIPHSGILYAHAENSRHLATPDCFIWDEDEGSLIEIKTTNEDWSERVPLKILRQIYWQAYVLDAHFVGLAWWPVDDLGQPLTIEPLFREIEVDLVEVQRLVDIADDYFEWVDAGCPGFDTDLPIEVVWAIETHVISAQAVKDAKAVIDKYLASTPDAATGLNRSTPVGSIAYTVSNTPTDVYDEDAARAAAPEVFAAMEQLEKTHRKSVTKTSKRLTISAPKPPKPEKGATPTKEAA